MKVISQYYVNELNAGPKAKVDVENILHDKYNATLYTFKIRGNLEKKLALYVFRFEKLFFYLFHHRINDLVVYQLPLNKRQKTGIISKKSIGFIHDIEGLRRLDNRLLAEEINLYNQMDVIISHNSIMTKFLRDNGLIKPTVELGLFDYLIDELKLNKQEKMQSKKIVFVGNLTKSKFLNELDGKKMDFEMVLYGIGNYNKNNEKLDYKGAFSPDELPSKIAGDLGLVWDGVLSDENNDLLNYTKYNNPHKLSCYIAAGIPVVVWDKSAVAEFVKDNNIGYTVSNLYDLNKIDFSNYEIKRRNVLKIRKKIITGHYTLTAIKKAIKIIENAS